MNRKSAKDVSINADSGNVTNYSRLPGEHANTSISHLAQLKLVILATKNGHKYRQPHHYLILITALFLSPAQFV